MGGFGNDPFFNPISGREHIAAIKREADETSPLFAENWHSDWSFLAHPPSGTCLMAVEIPPIGGDTLFSDQVAAFAALPDEKKAYLRSLTAIHSASRGYAPDGLYGDDDKGRSMDIKPSEAALARQTHPLVKKHQETGEEALFCSVSYVVGIEGMGIFDLAHTQYTESLVTGAMQKAGRDLTLESAGSQEAAIDQQVIDTVSTVTPGNATITLEKLAHFDFGDIGEAEAFTDNNDNDICDNGEPYEDANGNGTYDTDRGQDGIGGARDAVVYTAVVTYPRLFPIAEFIGIDKNVSVRASTILRNQPYDQQDLTVETLNCSWRRRPGFWLER